MYCSNSLHSTVVNKRGVNMKYFLALLLFFTGSFYISLGAEDNAGADPKKADRGREIPPEIKLMIERIKKLSEDEAFADMDRTIKMGNKTRLQVILYVYPTLKNRQDTFGRTPLYNSVFAGHLDLVKYLLAKHANLAIPDVYGDTPLHRAAADGYTDIMGILMKCGAHYYAKNKKGRTPLFNAALNDEVEAARLLLKAGDRINRQDKNGDTPLHLAALNGSEKMVKFLLKNHADSTRKNIKGKTPYDMAQDPEIKKLLAN